MISVELSHINQKPDITNQALSEIMRLAPDHGLTKFSINFDGAPLNIIIDGNVKDDVPSIDESVKTDVCKKLDCAREISFTCVARQPAKIREELLEFAEKIFNAHSEKQASLHGNDRS